MINNSQIITILKELINKSKEYKDGYLAPKECILQISELENYNFFLFELLEKTERILWTKKESGIDKITTTYIPVLKIKDNSVTFIPRIVREYLIEMENKNG